MTNNHTFILSGRYQIIRSLGTGQTSTVYLARHLSLDAERAIKVIPKTGASPVSVLTEAQLLKSLNHPGIPMIFDIEEDDSNYYLVEEYIQGESLEAYLLHHKFISSDLFLSFCEQLCDIFRYLHSLHPTPILYQDLKPEHIIVCGTQLKLIDFGVTWNTGSSGNNFPHRKFGQVKFLRLPQIFTVLEKLYNFWQVLKAFIIPGISDILSKKQLRRNRIIDMKRWMISFWHFRQHYNKSVSHISSKLSQSSEAAKAADVLILQYLSFPL